MRWFGKSRPRIKRIYSAEGSYITSRWRMSLALSVVELRREQCTIVEQAIWPISFVKSLPVRCPFRFSPARSGNAPSRRFARGIKSPLHLLDFFVFHSSLSSPLSHPLPSWPPLLACCAAAFGPPCASR
jgi:hypothetical protein